MADIQKVGGSSNKRGVLLICFSPETLGALVSILRQAGESAMTPPSIQDAWACVKQDVVGCIILDLTGPAAEALAFFRAVRSSQKSCGIPFLFLCGSQEEVLSLGRWGVEFAQDDWLVLPSPADEFLSKTRNLVEQNKAARVAGSFGPVRASTSSMGLQKVHGIAKGRAAAVRLNIACRQSWRRRSILGW
jgi:DNA-binding response OmpR family regulator